MSTEQTASATGSCLCTAVQYEVSGPLRSVLYCHCEQCRRTSGHIFVEMASDYYQIADGLPQYAQDDPQAWASKGD